MFSYVAKSLLSKTLRTFLRKYLEDIELESIDYSSAGITSGNPENASGSGWGVRLSNVKLREGTELMNFPGKRKRAVTRKKKVRRNRSKMSSAASYSKPVSKDSKQEKNSDGGEENVVPRHVSEEKVPITSDTHMEEDVITFQPVKNLSLHEKVLNRDQSENVYLSSSPTMPTQSIHGLCGVPSNFCLNANSKRSMCPRHQNPSYKVPRANDGKQLRNDNISVVDGSKKPCAQYYAESRGLELSLDQTNQRNSSSADGFDDNGFSSNINDAVDDDLFIEVQEEATIEDSMLLVVGAGGVIGSLNIRLVGKELHVTAKDAHLIMEATSFNMNSADAKSDGISKTPNPRKTSPDTSTSSSSEADLLSFRNEGQGETTIGEKIEKKSTLAKFLSMIPHLFLRNFKVSLILPEEMGDTESTKYSCNECTIFELGIDFLSVTSGDDFLDELRFDTRNLSSEGASTTKPQPHGFRPNSSILHETLSSTSGRCLGTPEIHCDNIFERKRIRSGKGPGGGLWLKIIPPLGVMTQPSRTRHPNEPKWAKERFLDSSESFFFRCSGVDLHARMLVDRKKHEVNDIENMWSSEYEDYTMDSMLFGVDYIDPISLTRHQIKESTRREKTSKSSHELSDVTRNTDSNGIQSIPFASNFHWIAQRAHCYKCTNSHLPLNDCFYCWDGCVRRKPMSSSLMNSLMPLPGFVFCLRVSNPLEVNVDRTSLEAFGYMTSLFTPEEAESTEQESNTEILLGDSDVRKRNIAKDVKATLFDHKSFPSYMQPDTIYLSGLYVSKLIVRVEAITPRNDSSLKFRFWQFVGQSILFEESRVDSEIQFFRDVTFHVGYFECKDLTGVCENNILVAGIDIDMMPTECRASEGKVHLPCTASHVLGVPISLSAIEKRSCGLHMRLIHTDVSKETVSDDSISTANARYLNIRLGLINIVLDSALFGDICKVSNEADSIIFSRQNKLKEDKTEGSKQNPQKTLKWLIQISTKGGTLSYQPKIKLNIPESKFRVRTGSEGLSFESFLQTLGIEYGPYIFQQPTPPSIMHLALLPEGLRMNILLYLDDLTPLERVLNVKQKNSSAFLQSHAINKNLTNLVKSEKERVHCQTYVNQRSYALSRLQSLDTASLEALLAMHGKSFH